MRYLTAILLFFSVSLSYGQMTANSELLKEYNLYLDKKDEARNLLIMGGFFHAVSLIQYDNYLYNGNPAYLETFKVFNTIGFGLDFVALGHYIIANRKWRKADKRLSHFPVTSP